MKIQELFERPRARVIVISIAVFLLLVGTIVAIACFNRSKDSEGSPDTDDEEFIGAFAEKTTEATLTDKSGGAENNTALLFESNGDGTCRVVGVSDKTLQEIEIPEVSPEGDTVTAIAKGAFRGCAAVEKIHIPAGVKSVGEGAFSGCSSLSAFVVDYSNTKLAASGGVLFSKDKSTLICYPSSRVGKSYMLPESVEQIAPCAFEDLSFLQKILYEGSASEFRQIEVGDGNDYFLGLSVTYNYAGAK